MQYRGSFDNGLGSVNIAIAGDLHGCWSTSDRDLLLHLSPDAILFVGDLSEGDIRLVKAIKELSIPTAVILGNHDRGFDRTGELLRRQLNLLGDIHCGWSCRHFLKSSFSVVGGRPCSAGGGYYLSEAVKALFGPVTLEESTRRILLSAKEVPKVHPLVILAHSGPSGLGSDSDSLCGRDWKAPSLDWGDRDLEIAIQSIRKIRVPDIVVFGHMHHYLRGKNKLRKTFYLDKFGTAYLNAACVPRSGVDDQGNTLTHFSWVRFINNRLSFVSHRWFNKDGSIAYEEVLFSRE